jgi:hypothetical protein
VATADSARSPATNTRDERITTRRVCGRCRDGRQYRRRSSRRRNTIPIAYATGQRACRINHQYKDAVLRPHRDVSVPDQHNVSLRGDLFARRRRLSTQT